MKEFTVALSSVTMANKTTEILRDAGIRSRITRLPKQMTKRGCAYGVSATGNGLGEEWLTTLLQQNRIHYSEILTSDMHRYAAGHK